MGALNPNMAQVHTSGFGVRSNFVSVSDFRSQSASSVGFPFPELQCTLVFLYAVMRLLKHGNPR